jgi:hypothetical protein
MPAAGSIGYVRTSPDDAKAAAKRLRNGELTVASAPPPVAPVETAVTAPAVDPATVTTDPAATADPAPATTDAAVAATDAAVAPEVGTTAPPVAESTSGGAVGAP